MDTTERMEEVEDLVAEEVTENVEQATEEPVTQPAKLFTQEDLNAAVGKAKARERAKVEKQYKRMYGGLTDVLRAGTGKETVEEITDTFTQFYQKKGVTIPQSPAYSDEEIELLASAEAKDIIDSGFEEVVEEVNRLADLGTEKMTAREKALFRELGKYRKAAEVGRELQAIGVTEEVYNSPEFQKFSGMFASTTPITEVYKLYAKTVKPNVEPIGSMKNGSHDEGKTFYTPEDVDKLTPKDYDNPVIFQRVRDSMKKW